MCICVCVYIYIYIYNSQLEVQRFETGTRKITIQTAIASIVEGPDAHGAAGVPGSERDRWGQH